MQRAAFESCGGSSDRLLHVAFSSQNMWQIPAEFYLTLLNLELTHTPKLDFIAEQIFALCAKSEDDPSKQAKQPANRPTEWRQTVRRQITCMHLLSHSDGINQKGFNGERC
jgi:hypothetical protein